MKKKALHPFLLRFHDSFLEQDFKNQRDAQLLQQFKTVSLLGFFFYGFFALFDYWLDQPHFSELCFIRLTVIGLCAVLYFLIFPFPQLNQLNVMVVLTLCQAGHSFLILTGNLPLVYCVVTFAIVNVFMFSFSVLFKRALVLLVVYLAGFAAVLFFSGKYSTVDIAFGFTSLFALSVAAALGSSSKEKSARLVYLNELHIKEEKEKSENLLLNILPEHTVKELQEHGNTEPVRYASATIMFTDFVSFSRSTETMGATDLVARLDGAFFLFDDIIFKNGLERLKTIGDSYMSIGGVPQATSSHALDTCLAALEIREFNAQMNAVSDDENPFWDIRIGINTGPVIGGVVGKTKFSYDVWGKTVNLASRLESSAPEGAINIGASTWELVKDYFDTEYRGTFEVKNMGAQDMYLLLRLKEEYSEDEMGIFPNEKLTAIRRELLKADRELAKG